MKENEINLSKKQVDEIVDFINNKFEESTKYLTQLKNYKELVVFLEGKGYEIGAFDAGILFSRCPNLKNTINSIMCCIKPVELTKSLFDYLEIDAEVDTDMDEYNDQLVKEYLSNKKTDSTRYYLDLIGQFSVLTQKEEIDLFKRYENGDMGAFEDIVNHNLKLVISIAKRYMGRGLDFDDLIEEGNLGLLTAIEKFKPELGYKFSTCAYWWIRQRIQRSIFDSGRTIRVPVHLQEDYFKVKKVRDNYENTYGYVPTNQEISEITGLSVEKIYEGQKAMVGLISLNSSVSEDSDEELEMFIEDDETNVEQFALSKVLSENFKTFFESTDVLDEREKNILMLRFGCTPRYTLEQIGRLYGVTRERVRQIEKKALRNIKNSDYIKGFKNNYTKVLTKNN